MKPKIETFQNEWELDRLVSLFNDLCPARVLEVGSWHGGTLWHWLQQGASVVAVDDGMRRADDWVDWAQEAEAELTLIQGSSHDIAIVETVRKYGPYDFLFIDADHSYDSVRRDWENYSPMVNDGGVIAFHDIIERRGYGVSQLWGEIKSVPGTKWMEISQTVQPQNESRCGIGVLFR